MDWNGQKTNTSAEIMECQKGADPEHLLAVSARSPPNSLPMIAQQRERGRDSAGSIWPTTRNEAT